MGGNALKDVETRRYDADEYYRLRCEVEDKLMELFPLCRTAVLRAYKNKPTFGDMDILIDSKFLPDHYIEMIDDDFSPRQIFKNGNCLSFEYKQFQIDLIITTPDEFNTSRQYYSFNDLGNLLGRVAHSMGLKLGHDGLSFNWRIDTYQFRNKVLLTEFKDILLVLGYSWSRYSDGFDDLTDIFEFVVSSPFFNKEIFMLENRNHTSRVRDTKRKTYTQFLEWLETKEDLPAYPKKADKSEWLPYLFEKINGFQKLYDGVMVEWNNAVLYKIKFNGNIVREITGLDGKELGEFMKYTKMYHPCLYDIDFVLTADEQTINNIISLLFRLWKL